ncbi:hypothetical protein RRG08_054372 [Elysia crispata]|uniref:Uncharacterized protein n=1 Tax=Elysia crispata TaxID=231223 RepID=A0AAE1E9I3_9GAST|nr:hypothetical protein RRG08_054372 [Elysia crispata]
MSTALPKSLTDKPIAPSLVCLAFFLSHLYLFSAVWGYVDQQVECREAPRSQELGLLMQTQIVPTQLSKIRDKGDIC